MFAKETKYSVNTVPKKEKIRHKFWEYHNLRVQDAALTLYKGLETGVVPEL